jgi:hypothetical protein
LRLPQDFASAAGVEKALLSIPVRKPAKNWFIRVCPDTAYQLSTAVIELKEDQETYLVSPALRPALAKEVLVSARALYTAVTRQGVLFLWPIRLPGADGRTDEWSRTSLVAAARAQQVWVRVVANLSLGAYDVYEASARLSEPDWPSMPFNDLLRVAFQNRVIDSLDHPVLRQLRGEV